MHCPVDKKDVYVVSDAETVEKVKYYKQLMAEKEQIKVIGKTKVFLDGDSMCKETNLGNLITDSFIRFVSIHRYVCTIKIGSNYTYNYNRQFLE